MFAYTVSIILILNIFPIFAQNSFGCEMGWRLFNQYCYRAVDTKTLGVTTTTLSFDAALDYCKSNGAYLASITSAFENAFIQSNLTLINGYRYWIGLQINDQNIFWIDGTPYNYNNLNKSTITNGEILSAYFTPGQQWVAVPSSSALQGRICKKRAIPNMPPIHNGSALGDWFTHDPTILKTTDGRYIVYCTLNDLQATDSKDRQNFYSNGSAFPNGLQWAKVWMNGSDSNMWAPDTSYHNGQYWMYYAASTFGSKKSAIGVATSTSGNTATWTDYGEVFNSTYESWNAIDPNLFVDDDGTWYLTFGSWSSGIWQYVMDSKTGFVKDGSKAVQLANGRHDGIEASGLFKKGSYYYLLNSIGYCCRGMESTYITIIGRSTSPQGPFVDKAGTPMTQGGGTELLVTEFPIIGPGGPYVYHDVDADLIVYHYYDGLNNGSPRLAINYLGWTDDGWPYMY